MRSLLALAVLLAAAASEAAGTALVITDKGYSLIVVNEAGETALVPVSKIIDMRGGGGDPPPDQPPPTQNPTVQLVKGLAAEVNDPAGARALALVYKTIGEQVDDGKIKPEDAFPAVRLATNEVLKAINAGAKWDGFRAKLGEHITLKLQNGEFQHARDYVKFLRDDVPAGLTASAPASAALSPELIRSIIELVLKVIAELLAGAVESPV